jgi:AAHS family 4-hydroxybenzoate transporter-like MFS transporter
MAEKIKVDIADIIENQENWWFSISTFLLCCLVLMADGFDNQALNYTAPAIIRDWGISRELMTPVFQSSIFGWMAGALTFSMIADAIGRRNAMVFAAVLFGSFTYLISFSTNLWELSAYRFCASFGVGGAMPMAIALISDYTPTKRRGLLITGLFLGYSIGSSGGGFLAAELIVAYGWQSVFQVGGIVAIGVAGILIFTLPESVRYLLVKNGSQERIRGYVKRMQPNKVFAPNTEFIITEAKKGKGVPLSYLFKDGRSLMTMFLWLALGFSFVTHFFISSWLATILADYMPIEQAVRTKAMFQAGAFFGVAFGFLIDRYGIPVVTLTKTIGAIPVAAIGFFIVADAGMAVMMLAALASGIFVLGGTIGLNAISGMIYPTFIRSTGTGAAFCVARIGALIGPAFGGLLLYLDVPVVWIFVLGAIPMVLSGAAAYGLSRTVDVLHPRKAPHTEDEPEEAPDGAMAPARS